MKKTDKTRRLTLAAMFAALSFVLLYIGTLSGILDMSAAVFCGLVTLMLLRECGARLTAAAVVSCGALCFILIPDKTVGILYLTVGGVYPYVKPFAEKLRGAISWAVKIAIAVTVILIYIGAIYLFIPAEAGRFMIPVGLAFGVLCFVLYDILLTRFGIIYEHRLRFLFKKK